ncbi:hypothetical protein HAX54_019220 [Datura stramonium]|uniref:Uncharacterized protein n=1 Tax=Datura stramonium TaxID=4076 RepID=A0ABS8UQR7_DATST|nr:hypothetical protein [Datura stramonium]
MLNNVIQNFRRGTRFPSQMTPSSTSIPESSSNLREFENPFSKNTAPSSTPQVEDSSVKTPFIDSTDTSIDLTTPSLIPSSEEGATTEKRAAETSYDYLFEGDLPEERGTTSNILAYGDKLIVQRLTQMTLGDERVHNSEKIVVSRLSSPAF